MRFVESVRYSEGVWIFPDILLQADVSECMRHKCYSPGIEAPRVKERKNGEPAPKSPWEFVIVDLRVVAPQ